MDERDTLTRERRLEVNAREGLHETAVRRRSAVSLNRKRNLALRLEVLREEIFGRSVSRVRRLVVELGRQSVRALVQVERVDVGSSDLRAFVDDLEGRVVRVEDERRRVVEDRRERDPEGGTSSALLRRLSRASRDEPEEFAARRGVERIARTSANDDRRCNRVSSVTARHGSKLGRNALSGMVALPPKPLMPGKVVWMFEKGMPLIGMSPALVRAVTGM